LIVTSPTTKIEFESITSKPIAVITNGYDVEKVVKKPLDEKFTLAHIGSLLSARNPIILWKALQELILENEAFKLQFQLKLIGAVSNEVLQSIAEFGLNNHLNYLGYLPHDEAIIEQRSSQVLLLIEIDSEETKCIIPGKLFEYMVSERPIIAIGPVEADFAQIIKETNTGAFFTYDELESLKAKIQCCFEQYQQNNLMVYPVGLQEYSRKALTEKLAKLLVTNH
jgi:glycosyltransferase involved in cell wall biosynthesis